MSTFKIRKYTGVVDQIIPVPDDCVLLVETAAATTATISVTLEPKLVAEYSGLGALTFADDNPDTITRSAGSWLEDGFSAGMTITVASTVSNNDVFTIDSVDDTAIVLDIGDALVVEEIVANTATIAGLYDAAAVWFVETTVTADGHTYQVHDHAPTGFRIIRASGSGTVNVWVKS